MDASTILFDELRASLAFTSTQHFIIAYSGGIDSHVLLHSMSRLCSDKTQMLAVHVDHGLQEASHEWAQHCHLTARDLGVPSHTVTLNERPGRGDSTEDWARRQRYSSIQSMMRTGDILLTAHHRDDLAETFFLQLLRGAGPHGLSSIPQRRVFGMGSLVRPMLNVGRSDIQAYAKLFELNWIDDPSNDSEKHDRNFVRHQIMPKITQRWPGATRRILHAAELQQQAAALLDEVADDRLGSAVEQDRKIIRTEIFAGQDLPQRRWVLRRWIANAGFPIPDSAHLDAMLTLVTARQDSQPRVRWKGAELKRYREHLFLSYQPTETPRVPVNCVWNIESPLETHAGLLTAKMTRGRGISAELVVHNVVTVDFRRGGERCRPENRQHSQSLKRLFQEWGVPPWRRSQTPLIFVGDAVAAVAGICTCAPYGVTGDEMGWEITWTPSVE
ncbi:MAG: tRNA(Ile)-lysidine synthase [Gammaproteobacteria bacterium]|jgi:tRNA(Ile)-lysidine synthase